MTETLNIGGHTFTVRDHGAYVPARVASRTWAYTDKAGHAHKWDQGYPTLVTKSAHVDAWDDDDGDIGYDRTWYECPLCSEVIRPGTTEEVFYQHFTTTYEVDGVPVTREEYEQEYERRRCRDPYA